MGRVEVNLHAPCVYLLEERVATVVSNCSVQWLNSQIWVLETTANIRSWVSFLNRSPFFPFLFFIFIFSPFFFESH